MRRSGQPSRPRARICCLLSSPKMLAIPAGNHALHRRVNVLGRRYFTGRFSGVHDWPVLGVHRGSKPLLPLFDAIVNALHAIEESAGRRSTIDIRPERDWSQTVMGEFARAPIHGFLVSDSGIGFTDQNFVSFDTADS